MIEEVASGKFFDHIEEVLDDVEDGFFGTGAVDCNAFPPVWLGDSPAEGYVRYEDIVQLEWQSSFVQDSFSKMKRLPINHVKRPRSKRSRPTNFLPRATIQLPPPTYFVEARRLKKNLERQKNKRKHKIQPLSGNLALDGMSRNQNEDPNATPTRKCMHCGITKTPQWRAGPNGPKSLCNACGVRHKSGRLFPEYRPAASPTFVPLLHSNSHRKVLEMRNSKPRTENYVVPPAAAATACQPDRLPKSDLHPA